MVNINSINQLAGKILLLFTYARGRAFARANDSPEHLLLRHNVGTNIKAQAKI